MPISGVVGKAWGTTECILSTPFVEIHKLHIEPGWRCSRHRHSAKLNAFYVLSGELFIDVQKRDYPLTDTTRLTAGMLTEVPSGEIHWFRTGAQPCECLEIYYPEPLSSDIDRLDHGQRVAEDGSDIVGERAVA